MRTLGCVQFILSQSGHNSGIVVRWTFFYQQAGVYLSFFWIILVFTVAVKNSPLMLVMVLLCVCGLVTSSGDSTHHTPVFVIIFRAEAPHIPSKT